MLTHYAESHYAVWHFIYNYTKCHNAECHYMIICIILSVAMLNVMVPIYRLEWMVLQYPFPQISDLPEKHARNKGAKTFSITTLSIMTFSITTLSLKGLFVTLSINDTRHYNTVWSAIMLSVKFCLLLCWMSWLRDKHSSLFSLLLQRRMKKFYEAWHQILSHHLSWPSV
jgi:hypothetical protein